MEKLNEILLKKLKEWESIYKTEKEKTEHLVEILNNSEGDLDDSVYDCKKCKNKGFIYFALEESGHYYEVAKDCDCKNIRKSIMNMKRSGLEPIIKRCTFDKYETTEEWQQIARDKAVEFAENCENAEEKWFYVGGGIGSGKTHLCTAIVRELLKKGMSAKYMLWVKDGIRLKAMVNDIDYKQSIDEYRKAPVLYIDDFFKITKDQNGNELYPTAADIRLAYEIIDYRYQNADLITIISSERFISEIEEIDSAVGTRIFEKTKDNAINIARDKNRNYRTRSMRML